MIIKQVSWIINAHELDGSFFLIKVWCFPEKIWK